MTGAATIGERGAVITGIGQSDVGRRLNRSPLGLTLDACLEAIADAGLTREDIDGIATYPGNMDTPGGFSGAGVVEVQDALGEDFGSKIAFVSITVDPEHDTPEVLKDYAAAWEAKTAGWSFLSGPPAAVHDVVRRYGVYAAKTADGAIDHTLLTSIIDPRGVLRVQYLGMRFDPAEFRRDLLSLVAK